MSVCSEVETKHGHAQPQQKVEEPSEETAGAPQPPKLVSVAAENKLEPLIAPGKNIAKLVVSTTNNVNPVLQKVVNPPLITVLNSTGPLTVVKSLCVTTVVSTAPHYTLVNSAPLNVTNAVGKAPTITVLNCGPLSTPVTVVKALSAQQSQQQQQPQQVVSQPQQQLVENISTDGQNAVVSGNNIAGATSIVENRGHNVFVKNTCPDSTVPDNVPQSHKLLTANNFPQSNVLTRPPKPTTANGQKNKVKVLSNIVMAPPGSSQTSNNLMVNKVNSAIQPRYVPRQKLIGANGATTKYVNKPPPLPPPSNNVIKSNISAPLKATQEKSPARLVYPSQKGQVKTLPPNSYIQKPLQGIKTLAPQNKGIPGQIQRTGSGLRTIPPQRSQKVSNKPNYIGKHAVQAQKVRTSHGKMKGLKIPPGTPYGYVPPMQEKQMTFNQALTAQIIETLSNPTPPQNMSRYEILPARYDGAFSCPEMKQDEAPKLSTQEEKAKSGLDALSLICQAVLLDHNYNATLPSESPTRPSPPLITQAQINGISANSLYSPPGCKRRALPSNTVSTSSLSNISLAPTNSSSITCVQDDDATSDISDSSERKHDTEGEETDTAPEAEAVNNEEQFDHYGDYTTRCLCGFIHDDGYMVECDRCKVWQHVQCVVKNKQVPDEYLCEVCDPTKPVDRHKARMIQQQWLRERQLLDNKIRKEAKGKEVLKHKEVPPSDSDSSDAEQNIAHNNNVIKGRGNLVNRRRSEGPQKSTKKELKEPVQRRQKRKDRKVVKRKTKAQMKQQQSHSDDENQDTWASHLPQLRQWIEKYEEAVTNHYSPELRARISSIRVNGVHSDNSVQFDPTVCKCRVHTQPLTEIKYLVSTVQLTPNTPVIELRGKYMLSTQHRNSGGSLATRQHTQRPGPFLFFYRLHKDNTEVCVDTRTYGNSARFIRRSCKPNAELRHCIEKGVLHLYVVSITVVEKNCELTIKHESHDLAAIGTTQIACACGSPNECTVNKTTIKKNGEVPEAQRKRRGRRTTSACLPSPEVCMKSPPIKDECVAASMPQPSTVVKQEKMEVVEENKIEFKEELAENKEVLTEIKQEVKQEPHEIFEVKSPVETKEAKKEKIKEETKSPSTTPITTRRSSHYKSDKEDSKESPDQKEKEKNVKNNKKLSREERKLEAILRAIEQMEKADQRKQEHQAKQAHRRESEPGPNTKEEEKQEPKMKRRRRKGRSRTTSTNNQSRRSRLNSTDSCITSGDENMLSPNDNLPPNKPSFKDNEQADCGAAAGLLLALSNREREKTPTREIDSNSNSAHSSPETQLSSACLLVQAAVEPLEQGFKFPKTKKGLMNEWLNKAPDIPSASQVSPTSHINVGSEDSMQFYAPAKNLSALAQAATYYDNTQPQGSAKKRWLRQAISEDHSGDSPVGRPDSPPISDSVAPPKKRRLPRESISNDNSPPLTPTGTSAPVNMTKSDSLRSNEGGVEIISSPMEGDSPTHHTQLESEAILKERAARMKQEFTDCIVPSSLDLTKNEVKSRIMLDPRLAPREGIQGFSNSDHLVGTVEKTLSIFGFENSRSEASTPAKRKVKLSITEYRQRKKQSVSDRGEEQDQEMEAEIVSVEENNSSESFKTSTNLRPRSCSTSSSTSLTSSDEENAPSEVLVKAPAFNCEPTELERQREISSLRLKKAFGLAIDAESKKIPPLDVEAILRNDIELEPKVKPIPIPSPTFPIPGSIDIIRNVTSPSRSTTPLMLAPITSPTPEKLTTIPAMVVAEVEEDKPSEPRPETPERMETGTDLVVEEEVKSGEKEPEDERRDLKSTFYYMPDEEDAGEVLVVPKFEKAESVSYVPPFNNPVYPNSGFTRYTSTIDDDARYEGRNPSPPPEFGESTFDTSV